MIMRPEVFPKKNLLTGCAKLTAALFLLFIFPQVKTLGQKSCPLTDSQSQKAVDAWAKIAAFLTTEPRCVNCHGKVNPYIEGVGLDPNDPFKDPEAPVSQIEHGGGKQNHENTGVMDQGCKKCHNDMAKEHTWVEVGDKPPVWPENGPFPNWTLAPTFLSFVDKDATTLCRQIKRAAGTAEGFLGHLKDDNGRTNFAGTAYLGNRGLSMEDIEGFNVKIEPPSITHAAVVKLGQDWVNAMGGKFQGDEGCGCELRHSRWSGQIRSVKQYAGDQGHTDLLDWLSTALTTVTLTVKNGVGSYHGHVEAKTQTETRQSVFPSGYKKTGFGGSETHGDATAPTTIDVSVDEAHGTYSIQMGIVTPDGRPMWPNKIGEMHWTSCTADNCTSGKQDVGMPSIEAVGPFYGKTKDPNHIQASYYNKKTELGQARNGVMIQITTIDLWRSGSK